MHRSLVLVLLVGCLLAACSSGPSNREAVGATAQADSLGVPIPMGEVKGTYGAGCVQRAGGWTLPLGGSGAPNTLSVINGNAACTLTVTDLVGTSSTDYAGTVGPLALGYQSNPSAFRNAGALAFYANATQSSLSYTGDFTINIIISDSPNNATAISNNAVAAVTNGSATISDVPSPNFTIDISQVVDAVNSGNQVVVLETPDGGSNPQAIFTAVTGASAGPAQLYVVTQAPMGTFAQDDAAFNSGATWPQGAFNAPQAFNGAIPANQLISVGQQLPAPTTIILQNKDAASGIVAYQTFTITFGTPVTISWTGVASQFAPGFAQTECPGTKFDVADGIASATYLGTTATATCAFNTNDTTGALQCPVVVNGQTLSLAVLAGTGGKYGVYVSPDGTCDPSALTPTTNPSTGAITLN